MKTLIGTCGIRDLEGTVMVEEAMTLENMDKVQVDTEGAIEWRYAFHSLIADKYSDVVTSKGDLVEIVEEVEEGDECWYYEQLIGTTFEEELVVFYCNIYSLELFMGFFK